MMVRKVVSHQKDLNRPQENSVDSVSLGSHSALTSPHSLQVGNIGAGTLIWKKDSRLISAGALIIRKDPRLRLEGYNLTLAGVRPEDEGEYICEVETFNLEPIQQASKLSVLIPARVEPLPHSGELDIYVGSVRSSRSGNLCLSFTSVTV